LNEGLLVAEIELEREDQLFEKPEWVGEEVTSDVRYTNVALASHPFVRW
jgi:adenylate cyclase